MKLVYVFVLISLMGLVIPAYAQDPIREDEVQERIIEETRACKVEINSHDELTEAERTVAYRNCERQAVIRNTLANNDPLTSAELRSKLQNLERCEEWHSQYRFLTDEQFAIQKHAQVVRECIMLYNDEIWKYDGDDRPYILLDRLQELKDAMPDIPKPQPIQLTIELPKYEPSIIDVPHNTDKVAELEEKVQLLEEELDKKDAVIREQLKVIMDLFNKIRNVIFEPLGFAWSLV